MDSKLTTVNFGRNVTVRGVAERFSVNTKCVYCLKYLPSAAKVILHCQVMVYTHYLHRAVVYLYISCTLPTPRSSILIYKLHITYTAQ